MRYRRAFVPGGTYFFTLVTEQRRRLFADAKSAQLLIASIEHVRTRHPFELIAYVVLADHLHVLCALPPEDTNFPTRIRLIKNRFTSQYLLRTQPPLRSQSRARKGEQGLWQRRYWEHVVRDQEDFNRHADYIHYNPVRHGLVKAARDWPHSSFHEWVARDVYAPYWGSDDLPPLPEWMTRTKSGADE